MEYLVKVLAHTHPVKILTYEIKSDTLHLQIHPPIPAATYVHHFAQVDHPKRRLDQRKHFDEASVNTRLSSQIETKDDQKLYYRFSKALEN